MSESLIIAASPFSAGSTLLKTMVPFYLILTLAPANVLPSSSPAVLLLPFTAVDVPLLSD